ncbi:MAG: substrate-binding domain-containing protein, partial [Lachnospiraceae bacterium]|nr:substrate-binding domain-containing protein [Lachnospiraceae bacterium]
KEYPNIQVSIRCQSSYETIKALEDGSIDIGLIGETGRIGSLLFHPISEIEDIFIATNAYMKTLQARDGYNQKNPLALANLILPDQDNLSRRYVDRYLDPGLIDENRLIEVSTMDLVIEFAKNGLGIGCVIGDFVKKELAGGELVRIHTDMNFPKRKIGFAYRKESSANKSALAFLSFMKV